ncbi:hypothetical protein SELMODRAFT_406291 [Selaginella moellendorffii]|uniref:Protein kinase domain-containing protein n=1 Tax=Selaginella moellendorffii TaxID=88036 RepID=D8R1W5_SELML|nr:hypothetical protein SELMODRAFT_406291 [Selaginella moellendorffii]
MGPRDRNPYERAGVWRLKWKRSWIWNRCKNCSIKKSEKIHVLAFLYKRKVYKKSKSRAKETFKGDAQFQGIDLDGLLGALRGLKEELYELLKLPLPQEQERESTESKRLMDEQRALVRSMEAMEFNQASIRDLFSVERSTTLEDQAELEIRVLTKLSKSKERSGVVQLVDVFKDEDHYFLLMDLCQCSLTEVLLKKKKLSEHEAAVVIKNVARTVGKMHDMGMAHRDIKTDNILLVVTLRGMDGILMLDRN